MVHFAGNSLDYSDFGSQSSRQDIHEHRLRLLKLNNSVARRAAAALEDSVRTAAPIEINQQKAVAITPADVRIYFELPNYSIIKFWVFFRKFL